ncbi:MULTISPECIES: isochorismate synthase MenF [Leuconostoc]|uniref:isochorismate synthase n=2 Tax=Leuconostoc kimchii TaxID=136609 RepID=D5T0E4_LEUKI|nr:MULTISPECIES: isochorismate synthase [Leuconostoc]ADG39743.1 menaquinone-specific isochorismate synthase [Leuconostoc kimchii IMSNU 11154]AEJ30397.1 menaquinone-specific isochorismate synthase [Leuconostoc sp. C2]QBR47464.1 isochorismate synthase [Leuconostoc kimchii]
MKYHFSRALRDEDRTQLYSALDYFDTTAYFASADGKKELFGFDVLQQAMSPDNLTGDVVFGGCAFDDQLIINTQLMNGTWFVPKIFVTVDDHFIKFESNTHENFEAWLTMFKQRETAPLSSRDVTEEKDWLRRTQQLIDTLITSDTLKKVVFGRQKQYQLSDVLDVSRLITALKIQKNTYRFILKQHHELFVSATPERLVKVMNGGQLETAAVAGTIRRGTTVSEDIALGQSLRNSAKNRQEHQYVVDNILQKLQNVTTELVVPEKPKVLSNRQVQHLYTPINARINSPYGVVDIMRRLHPTPALGGVPQEEAQQYIRQHEKNPRGLFAAPIGYYTANNTGEFIIGIRSMYVNQKTHLATLFAGAGIVADSNAAQELQETNLKFEPMRQLLRDYANGN